VVVDIHSHILPGVDDGARNMDETIEMLNMAVAEGIDVIVATPHCEVGVEQKDILNQQHIFEKVSEYIVANQIPIQLFCGNEIYYSESVLEMLQNGLASTINGTRYVLLEFPMHAGCQTIERALMNFLYAGYWPIIAHAERYAVLKNIKKVHELVDVGVYIQVNASALLGKEGWSVKRFCKQLIRHNLVHVVSTDSHGSQHRRPQIRKCLEYLDAKYGENYRRRISEENPLQILKGEKISGKNRIN